MMVGGGCFLSQSGFAKTDVENRIRSRRGQIRGVKRRVSDSAGRLSVVKTRECLVLATQESLVTAFGGIWKKFED